VDQDAHGLPTAGTGARFSAERVDEACAKALELNVVDANLIARMLERARIRVDLLIVAILPCTSSIQSRPKTSTTSWWKDTGERRRS